MTEGLESIVWVVLALAAVFYIIWLADQEAPWKKDDDE